MSQYTLCTKSIRLALGTSKGISLPQKPLRRAHMATFRVRLWRDAIGNDCPSTRHPFNDVSGNRHEANISSLRDFVGFGSAGVGWVDHARRRSRAAKFSGLVKPWALRRRTCRRLMLLCLSSRDFGEVSLVAFGEFAVVAGASFEC